MLITDYCNILSDTYIQWQRNSTEWWRLCDHWTCSHHKCVRHSQTDQNQTRSQMLFVSLPMCHHTTRGKNTINKLRQDAGYYEFANTKCMLKIMNWETGCTLVVGWIQESTIYWHLFWDVRDQNIYVSQIKKKKIKEQKEV